jgi:hypothetical protein
MSRRLQQPTQFVSSVTMDCVTLMNSTPKTGELFISNANRDVLQTLRVIECRVIVDTEDAPVASSSPPKRPFCP